MKFEEGKYYTHANFLDVYLRILTIFPDDKYYISWYNKNFECGHMFINNDMITVKNKQFWSEYNVK